MRAPCSGAALSLGTWIDTKMNVEVELPDLGDESGGEGTVSEWFCEEGESVAEGEPLLEVVSEGQTVEVPSPVTGVIIERLIEEDDLVRVGDILAIIEVEGELADEEE